MSKKGDVVEVTGRIGVKIVGDRLYTTVPSGDRITTYSIPFAIAQASATDVLKAVAAQKAASILRFRKKRNPGAHN